MSQQDQLAAENQSLKAQLKALTSKSGHRSTNKYAPPNYDYAKTVHTKVTTIVWDDVKFVSDPTHENFTKKVFRKTDECESAKRQGNEAALDEATAKFHKECGPVCVNSLNVHRSSRQTELKGVYDKYQKIYKDTPGYQWPSAEFWLTIALRQDVMPKWEQKEVANLDG